MGFLSNEQQTRLVELACDHPVLYAGLTHLNHAKSQKEANDVLVEVIEKFAKANRDLRDELVRLLQEQTAQMGRLSDTLQDHIRKGS